MIGEVLTLFSCKDINDIAASGAVGWFRLSTHRACACRHVVIYHNARDPRKPGDEALHRMPILVGDISGVYVDPRDGRTAVAIRAIANVEGPSQSNPGRSPVSYAASDLVAELRIGEWTSVAESSLKDAISERAAWDAAYPRP